MFENIFKLEDQMLDIDVPASITTIREIIVQIGIEAYNITNHS